MRLQPQAYAVTRFILPVLLAGFIALSVCDLSAADSATQAQAHADLGFQLAHSGNLERAEAELRQAVDLEPRNPEFLSAFGTLLAMDKKLEESTTIFRRALQVAPNNSTVRRYLAANLWQLHNYAEAKKHLQFLLQQHPDDPPSRLLLGMVSENTQDYATAAKMLGSVPNEVAKRPESIAALARSYYHLHERDKARDTLRLLSGDTKAIFLGAEIADQGGDYDEAERLLQLAGASTADSAALEYRRALVQYHAGRFAECQRALQPQIETTNVTSQVYNLLGWCYHKQNEVKRAVEAFEHAISLAPGDESNYLDLGKVLLAHNFLSVALDLATRATTQFPNSAPVFNLRGLVESRISQFTDAINSYAHAVQLDSGNVDSRLGLARAQVSAGLISDATLTFNAAIQRFPKDARLKVAYAELMLKQGDAGDAGANASAEKMLKLALAIDPANLEALYKLGNLELSDGRVAEACKNLQQAVKLSPQSSEPHFALARAYRRLKRTNDAAKEMDLYKGLKDLESRTPEASGPSDEAHN
jgi:tetratricopeptide (TPR) repeat protein